MWFVLIDGERAGQNGMPTICKEDFGDETQVGGDAHSMVSLSFLVVTTLIQKGIVVHYVKDIAKHGRDFWRNANAGLACRGFWRPLSFQTGKNVGREVRSARSGTSTFRGPLLVGFACACEMLAGSSLACRVLLLGWVSVPL